MKTPGLFLMMTLFLLVSATSTFAYFENGQLTAVIYHKADRLVALDLGNLNSMDMTATDQVLSGPGSFSVSDFNNITSLSNLSVSLYGRDSLDAGWTQWIATTKANAPSAASHLSDAFRGSADQLSGIFSGFSRQKVVSSNEALSDGTAFNGSTFDHIMHTGHYQNSEFTGSFNGYNTDWFYGTGKFTGEDPDPLKMYLYKFTYTADGHTYIPGAGDQPYQGVVSFYSNGSVVLNATKPPPVAPVPVPAGFILLGSGITALFGFSCRYFNK